MNNNDKLELAFDLDSMRFSMMRLKDLTVQNASDLSSEWVEEIIKLYDSTFTRIENLEMMLEGNKHNG